MNGISGNGKDQIAALIEEMFDNLSYQLVGGLPKLQEAKRLFITTENHIGLANLFIQGMGNKVPNSIEKELLRGLLESAHGYVEGLKNRTRSTIVERVDGLTRQAQIRKTKVDQAAIQEALEEEMGKARSAMIAIVEAESTKLRNLGKLMNISRVADSVNDSDPTVYFIVVKDNVTCKECIRLHLMPDQTTPRLWKLSDLKQGYHKRGEDHPSAFGLHPHCRCSLVYLSKGYGFNSKGYNKFVNLDHDEYAAQNPA